MQSELDAFLGGLGVSAVNLVSDRALAKARSKLHVPALWALNHRLISTVQTQGGLQLFKDRLLVCADGTLLVSVQPPAALRIN